MTAAYSVGSLAGAAAGIPAGRLLQRHGPRVVMTAGSVLGAAAVAGIAAAPSYWWFVGAWLAAGVAGQLSWRAVYLILAVLATVTIPAHALALRPPWPPRLAQRAGPAQPSPRSEKTKGTRADRQVLASRAFLQLVTAATLCAFAQYAALVDLVPLLTGRGLSPALAAWALGLGGAGAGRRAALLPGTSPSPAKAVMPAEANAGPGD